MKSNVAGCTDQKVMPSLVYSVDINVMYNVTFVAVLNRSGPGALLDCKKGYIHSLSQDLPCNGFELQCQDFKRNLLLDMLGERGKECRSRVLENTTSVLASLHEVGQYHETGRFKTIFA